MAMSDPTLDLTERTETDAAHVGPLRIEPPRLHPMTYIALGIATLALILSMAALSRDSGPNRVRVGNRECIVADGSSDQGTLFCATGDVPAP